jgi:hypothetical protein
LYQKEINTFERMPRLSSQAALAARLLLQDTLQHDEQRRELNGLRNELIGSLFDGSYRQIDGAMRRQYHYNRGVPESIP